jgi:hypothetical protein
MRSTDRIGIRHVREIHAGANDMCRCRACFGQGGNDDLEASPGLDFRIRVA